VRPTFRDAEGHAYGGARCLRGAATRREEYGTDAVLVRTASLLAAIALLSIVAACGGSGESSAPAPKLPTGIAEDLASRSERIARTLDNGDVCGAARQADNLQAATIEAINSGDVPEEFQEELQATANDLVDRINCPPPEPAPPEQEPTTDCEALKEEKEQLQGEKEGEKGEGRKKQLEEQIKAIEKQLKACEGDGGDED
jgi:hypothetical protein